MTSKSEVIASAASFRDALHQLSDDGHYSAAERDGFRLLHLFYADRLASFQIRPAYGDASEFYENPKEWADIGLQSAPACRPGDGPSQQPVYDAANNGGDSLEAVTKTGANLSMAGIANNAVSGLQGALLTTRSST